MSLRCASMGMGGGESHAAIVPLEGRVREVPRLQQEVDSMPTFEIILASEARTSIATGKRAELLQEYIGYIQRLGAGEAGVLRVGEGETTQAVRRRLKAASEALGKNLESGRTSNAVYFWPSEGRRRGRPRKSPVE